MEHLEHSWTSEPNFRMNEKKEETPSHPQNLFLRACGVKIILCISNMLKTVRPEGTWRFTVKGRRPVWLVHIE